MTTGAAGRSKLGPTVQPKSTATETDKRRKAGIRLAARTSNALWYRLVYSLIAQVLAKLFTARRAGVAVASDRVWKLGSTLMPVKVVGLNAGRLAKFLAGRAQRKRCGRRFHIPDTLVSQRTSLPRARRCAVDRVNGMTPHGVSA